MAAMNVSLRKYVFVTLIVLATAVISTFSWMSANQFLAGMDGMMRATMIDIARRTPVEPGAPVKVLSYTIAAEWQDLPEGIQQQFADTQIRPFRLYKHVERNSIFQRPTEAEFVLAVKFDDAKPVYVSQMFKPRDGGDEPPFHMTREAWIMVIGMVALLLFTLLVVLMQKSISRPVEKLREWAASLQNAPVPTAPPAFKYAELNSLAALIYQAMQSVHDSLKREQNFVRHASHELRTPIAVIRSSMELINRVRRDAPDDKITKPLMRIEHASHTMADLTETLLWLDRQDNSALATSLVALHTLVNTISEDLQYLLQGKNVSVKVETQEHTFHVSPIAVRIVLGNLIRNAFQHTHIGSVTIIQQGAGVDIVNQNTDEPELPDSQASLGFGLGLQMVSQLTTAMGWQYHYTTRDNGTHCVNITFEGN
ncbi:HAMP domain-containing histidine kinase [Aestuariibacter sp. GS-14]|uniref:sensor histidine kinase n=1 Tax=Aestuariibacter sp. GS-14 TaxID=2590670 RepID=UPI00112608AA|nr:HAMP domain-containing sensor histidine kinase [Aestuariibacter sp. GS-14]TPV52880.1 HAMP domain-containing histidine kinase [Aestuariibacter sp. GS-14]